MSLVWCPKGVDIVSDILSRSNDNFFVYFDPDVDGLFSGFLTCRFLKACGKTFETYINENRAHGFMYRDYEHLRDRTVIAVDFSITPDVLQELAEHNVKLINIDHHDIDSDVLVTYKCANDTEHINGVVINNQYSFEPEEHRYQSGCGMVFYTFSNILTAFDNELHRALVGLTLLSDIRPLENENARVFLKTCFTSKDKFLLYLYSLVKGETDFVYGTPRLDRNFIDYTFSPKFNALFRLNKGDVAIKAVFGERPPFDLTEARQEQNRVRDYIKANMTPLFLNNDDLPLQVFYIQDQDLNKNYLLSNFIGLVCAQMAGNKNKSTVTYVGDKTHIIRGSFRGRYAIDYLSIFRKCGFNCAGHTNAFGILETEIAQIDFNTLIVEIQQAEAIEAPKVYENRIIPVSNMSLFMRSDTLKQVALNNIYVRDRYRVYLKYTGTNANKVVKSSKMTEFILDGITVKSFDSNIDIANGLILPMYEREALTLFLK